MNTHSIGWAKAQAALYVHSSDGVRQIIASALYDVGVRLDGYAYILREPLNIKCTRDGYNPIVEFYVRHKLIGSVNVGQGHVTESNSVDVR